MATLYILGDSHTQALGPRLKGLFPQHNVRFQAFPGYSTARAHAAASLPTGVDVVVLSLGGNDFGNQAAAREKLVADVKARNPQARVLWFGPFTAIEPAAEQRHYQQTNSQRQQLPGLGIGWVDPRPWSKTGHGPDKVHFTGTAYTRLAALMASNIAEALAAPPEEHETPGAPGVGVGVLATGIAALVALWLILRRK